MCVQVIGITAVEVIFRDTVETEITVMVYCCDLDRLSLGPETQAFEKNEKNEWPYGDECLASL